MKTETVTIIYDGSYGLGPRFYESGAILSAKTVDIRGCKRRRTNMRFAISTPELLREAREINGQMERVSERARKFRLKLDELQPKP